MSSRRGGRGRPIDQTAWPADGKVRDWLVYCDQVHQANGLPSLSTLTAAMNMTSRSRVGGMLRGLALPTDEKQARNLLEALGAVGTELDRGVHLYKAARAEHSRDARGVDRPDWWLRSGYVQQVGDIAPLELLDRQDELAELAAWCTGGDEAYVWWQAGPRAGKSALMAWFVLHPPPGVWVVSFFVTARYTGQADSTAFTDEMIDQLAAITGQQVPPVTSSRERDRVRRQLFDAAAARAVNASHRLVLLIDGLDEDCGSYPGSGLPSIARCLPKYPADGVRVIVAGRSDPPLPADIVIDPDHPLHHCRVRVLDVSPHARQVMQLAQNELDHVLATDPDRHDGLGYQVLGLVTASGGGLNHDDLQRLTSRPMFEVDRLLRGVFGRTIAGRADPHATDRVFLFTHETLRVQAIDRLGRDTLAGFAERLHTWAASYQHRGWPADTPAYVLRGYPRMLADAKDLDRLVALATDPARHDRMLDATGGDAAALTEIATAQALNGAQPHPDLAAALRLAWYRNQLTDRNTNIPTQLPATWATLGQPIRAEALARSLTPPYRQAQALGPVAGAVAAAGEHERAEQIARSITDPRWQAHALIAVAGAVAAAGEHERARALVTDAEQIARSLRDPGSQMQAESAVAGAVAGAGEHERAEQIARSITDPFEQARALVVVARAVAGAGEHERAEQIARSIKLPNDRADALIAVARAGAAVGDRERARALVTEAEQIARSIGSEHYRAEALNAVAGAVAGAGEHERARALVTEAEQIARSVTNGFDQAQAVIAVAGAMAAAGEHERAEQIARSVSAHPFGEALIAVARAVAAAGEHERAEQIARSIDVDHWRADALIAVARAAAAAGEHERAGALVTEAEQIARSIGSEHDRAKVLIAVAEAVAVAGERERAEQIARSITLTHDRAPQAQALVVVAGAVAAAGERERAEQIARSIDVDRWRADALIAVARAVAVGEHERAGALVTDAEQIARSVAYHYGNMQALVVVAGAVAVAGEHERAEQIARSITDPFEQARALVAVAEAVAAAGEHERAEQIAWSITDPDQRARALTGLAGDADPVAARSLIITALSVGRWTIPLTAVGRLDSTALCDFVDECVLPRPHLSSLDNGPLSGTSPGA